MKIVIAIIQSLLIMSIRKCYHLYNAIKVQTGALPQVHWTFQLEGKGKVVFGDHVKVMKNVKLACARNAYLKMGEYTRLYENVEITVASETLHIGERTSIENGTRVMASGMWKIGNDVAIATHCQLFSRERGCKGILNVGDGTHIGDYTIIDVSNDVIIGKDVAIGPRCIFYTHDHDYKEKYINAPWKGTPITKPITISNGAWIGSNVTLLPGVTIGKKAIVGAGSIVTKNVEDGMLVVGNPAKPLKSLN